MKSKRVTHNLTSFALSYDMTCWLDHLPFWIDVVIRVEM